jgi:DNA-binding transcriptional ArsR family regulator
VTNGAHAFAASRSAEKLTIRSEKQLTNFSIMGYPIPMPRITQRYKTIVSSPANIRTLASSTRQDVLEVVEALGICTVTEVANVLRRRPDALYYHVRVLVKAGFLASERENGELQVRVSKRAVQLRYDPSSSRNRAAVIAVVRAILRGSERSFRRGFTPRTAVVEGPARNLWAGRVKGLLTDEELSEVNQHIEDLLATFQQRSPARKSAKLTELAFVLSPA